ncbi:hypothetical protein VNI00_008952 [Paramarasmius palmivorus]|uniref:Uncharacterized protein n=1 Tax=Paramarasmius palmivorus TaxID=297713 RepID=A0AAW0CRP8_9AGAR
MVDSLSDVPQDRQRCPLFFELVVDILKLVVAESKAVGDLCVSVLLLERDYTASLLPEVYRKIRISDPDKLGRLSRTLVGNPYLASLVHSLSLNFSTAPPLRVDVPYIYGCSYDIPAILKAVSATIRVLVLSAKVHPDIMYAMRCNRFPCLETLEAPHYVLMGIEPTIILHARLRESYRAFDTRLRAAKIRRLTVASMHDSWPALRRLCIQCVWGVPYCEDSLDFSHIRNVSDVAVALCGREWVDNIQHFLGHMIPPPNSSVVALLRGDGYFARHELYVGITFHPKVFIPVFGNPRLLVYRGPPDLEYLCCLTHVVPVRPFEEEFWVDAKEFVARRRLLARVFHEEGGTLVR